MFTAEEKRVRELKSPLYQLQRDLPVNPYTPSGTRIPDRALFQEYSTP
jgi:hypothetical protein